MEKITKGKRESGSQGKSKRRNRVMEEEGRNRGARRRERE